MWLSLHSYLVNFRLAWESLGASELCWRSIRLCHCISRLRRHSTQANRRRLPNVGLPLAHRLRRWPNSKPTLVQRLMFSRTELVITCFYHIRDLRRIRKSLSLDLAKQIAVALVSSRLDYCNSLFHNMPEKDIARLQRVQNCLARVVTNAPRFSRSVPILKRLHWLPVKFRIHFKICAITFRTLKENQPAYLADLLVRPKCSKYLSSTNSNRFVVPRIKTKTGSRAFSISGPASVNG